MDSIINYRLKVFLKKPQDVIEEYMSVLKYLKPSETKQEVFHMKLKDVENIKQELLGDIFEVVKLVEDIDIKKVMKMRIIPFFALYNSIKQQVETIARGELSGLGGGGDPRFEAVGGNEIMGKFGILNTILPLCEQFGWNIDEIENMRYSEIFSILLYNKSRDKVFKLMNKIKI